MKIFKQLLILLAINLLGDGITILTGLPIPGSIFGLFILLILLQTKLIREEDIKEVTDFLLGNMAFFFIPAGVGILASYHYLEGQYWQVALLITLSTFLVMGVTGLVTQFFIVKKEKKNGSIDQ